MVHNSKSEFLKEDVSLAVTLLEKVKASPEALQRQEVSVRIPGLYCMIVLLNHNIMIYIYIFFMLFMCNVMFCATQSYRETRLIRIIATVTGSISYLPEYNFSLA